MPNRKKQPTGWWAIFALRANFLFGSCLGLVLGRGPGRGTEGRATRRVALHRGQLNFLLEFHDVLAKETVGVHEILDGLARMDHGGVVAAAEVFTDGLERILGEGFGQVHSNLPRLNDLSFAGFLQ